MYDMQKRKYGSELLVNRHEIAHLIKVVDRLTVCVVVLKPPYGYRQSLMPRSNFNLQFPIVHFGDPLPSKPDKIISDKSCFKKFIESVNLGYKRQMAKCFLQKSSPLHCNMIIGTNYRG